MQAVILNPHLSDSQRAAPFGAARSRIGATATTPTNAVSNARRTITPFLTTQGTHLHRLRYIQAICENQERPCYLTVADTQLALRGLERYFGPLFAARQLALRDVCETLCWAAAEFGCGSLVEDIIQTLVTRYEAEQYDHRRRLQAGRGS